MSKETERVVNMVDKYICGLFGDDVFKDDQGQSANRVIAFFRKNDVSFVVLSAFFHEDSKEFFRSGFYNNLVRSAEREIDNFEIPIQLNEFISCLESKKPLKKEYVVGKVTEEERDRVIKNAEGWNLNPFTRVSDEEPLEPSTLAHLNKKEEKNQKERDREIDMYLESMGVARFDIEASAKRIDELNNLFSDNVRIKSPLEIYHVTFTDVRDFLGLRKMYYYGDGKDSTREPWSTILKFVNSKLLKHENEVITSQFVEAKGKFKQIWEDIQSDKHKELYEELMKEIRIREEEANISIDQIHTEFALDRISGTLDISETHCPSCGRELEKKEETVMEKLKKFNELQEGLEDEQPTNGLPVTLPKKEKESTSENNFDADAMYTLGLKPEDFDKIDKYEEMEKENERMKQLIDKRNNTNDFWTRDNRGLLDRVLGRFASRKLLAFVVTTVAFFMGLLVSQYYMAIVMTYIGSQAAVDLFNKVRLPQVDSEAWKLQGKRIASASTLANKINGTEPVVHSDLSNKKFL